MWAREYRGDLGIALSDVCGMDAFLRDFDLFFCKLFDGVRHDSGDPFEWGEKLIAHYQKMRIDPRSKTMVFSDSLNVPLAIRLFEYFRGRMHTAFGIGTNLTNDVGFDPLQIVIKMTRCNGQPVAKISDEPSKTMDYDPSYVAYLREVFQVPETQPHASGRFARRRLPAPIQLRPGAGPDRAAVAVAPRAPPAPARTEAGSRESAPRFPRPARARSGAARETPAASAPPARAILRHASTAGSGFTAGARHEFERDRVGRRARTPCRAARRARSCRGCRRVAADADSDPGSRAARRARAAAVQRRRPTSACAITCASTTASSVGREPHPIDEPRAQHDLAPGKAIGDGLVAGLDVDRPDPASRPPARTWRRRRSAVSTSGGPRRAVRHCSCRAHASRAHGRARAHRRSRPRDS